MTFQFVTLRECATERTERSRPYFVVGWSDSCIQCSVARQLLSLVEVERGMWFYRIQNPGSGLALYRTPSHRPEDRISPEQVYPHDSLVEADDKLQRGTVTYVRVKDTTGWLFATRAGEQTLLPVEVEEGMWAYTVNNDE
ncbi:hypothetical protein CYMTET_17375, partial [Cymbomonas tetramitiformis]